MNIEAFDYYEDTGIRELSHAVKSGDLESCKKIADCLSNLIPEKSTLVPIPSRTGRATTNLIICNFISKKINIKVLDCLEGKKRSSFYDLKKNGIEVDDSFFEYKLILPVNNKSNIFLLDVVSDTGKTLNSAISIFKQIKVNTVVFAKTNKNLLNSY